MSNAQGTAERYVHFRVWRQATENEPGSFEEFKVPYRKGANVISCLMEIQRNPVNAQGQKTTPVIWDSNCLEEVCGSCAMNINGKVRMACSAVPSGCADRDVTDLPRKGKRPRTAVGDPSGPRPNPPPRRFPGLGSGPLTKLAGSVNGKGVVK